MQCLSIYSKRIYWIRLAESNNTVQNEEIYRNANIFENGALWLANKELKLTRTNQVPQLTRNFNMVWAGSF